MKSGRSATRYDMLTLSGKKITWTKLPQLKDENKSVSVALLRIQIWKTDDSGWSEEEDDVYDELDTRDGGELLTRADGLLACSKGDCKF